MSSSFSTYLKLGFDHISDLEAYDHMLFVVALCAIYRLAEWKSVTILVTAFTIGHSITLALAVLDWISFPQRTIELLIPITIILTCLYNIFLHRPSTNNKISLNYLMALIFGLIHGMGFSNFLKSSLMPGQENQLVTQLLAFNIGIELGQLAIVGLILVVSFIAFNILKINQRLWIMVLSSSVSIVAIYLLIDQL